MFGIAFLKIYSSNQDYITFELVAIEYLTCRCVYK